MADTRIPTSAMGTLGTTPTIQSTVNTQSAKAHRSALLCFALALLTMATTAWFVVEGINATEPDSPARWAKVASGVLLLVLEASAFGLAGQWPEHSKVLRSLGWSVLALEITLMSVAQVSIGMTAAKSSSGGDTTISALEKKSAGARENAKRLQSRADELRATGRTANIRLAASEEKSAIKQTAIADEAETDAQKRRGNSTGTPIVEIVGKTGLIALSIALSVALSLSGIVLMHVAGSLWRRASGALPVDMQILELLQRIHGAPAVPAQTAPAPTPADLGPNAPERRGSPDPVLQPVKERPDAPAPAVPAEPVAPAPAPEKPSFGFIPNMARMSRADEVDTLQRVGHATSKRVNDDTPAHVNDDTRAPAKTDAVARAGGDVLTSSERVNDDTSAHANDDTPEAPAKARKQRVARDVAVMDSGTGPLDGFRYRRAMVGVKAGKIRPTILGMYDGVGVSAPTAKRFLEAMADAGVVERKGRGFALVQKGHAAVTFLALLIIGAMFLCFLLTGGAA